MFWEYPSVVHSEVDVYALKEICFTPLKTGKKKIESIFLSNALRFPQENCCLEGSQASLFVLLVRETWAWSICGMMLTGETEVLGEKPVLLPPCPPQIWYRLIWDRIRTSAVRGLWLTSWGFKTDIGLNYSYRPSPYRAVNTLRHGYKNQSVNVV